MLLNRFTISGGALIYAILGCSILHNPKSWFLGGSQQSTSSIIFPRSSQINLPIERNSTLSNDIIRIWHEPIESRVCVHLRKDARCSHPALLGRLSGPSLALLEWTDENLDDSSSGNILCGSYSDQWLDTRDYFIEIIVLYCEDFGFKTLAKGKDMTAWFDENLIPKCVENAEYNRITSTQSRISVQTSQSGVGNFQIGRWIKRPEMPSRPLFTRHQPIGCVEPSGTGYKPLDPLPEWCPVVTDRDKLNESTGTYEGLHEYDFQWGDENTNQTEITTRLQQMYQNQSRSPYPTICVIGDSHGRFIVNRSVKQLGVRGIMTFIRHNWPNETSIEHILLKKKCEVVVLQIGQWPASICALGDPFSFGRFYFEMKKFVQTITNVLSDVPGAKVYLPTVDMGPLMGAINLCKDWRTPTVMNAYSYTLQLIASESKQADVEYLDTNFIIQTHWDGSPDWLHLPEEVRYHKTIYILAKILKDIGYVFCEECLA